MPLLEDFLAKVGEAQVLSKLDLSIGFNHLLVDEDSQDKTTFKDECHSG